MLVSETITVTYNLEKTSDNTAWAKVLSDKYESLEYTVRALDGNSEPEVDLIGTQTVERDGEMVKEKSVIKTGSTFAQGKLFMLVINAFKDHKNKPQGTSNEGGALSADGKKIGRVSQADRDKIAELFAQGQSPSDIAVVVQRTEETVQTVLKELQVPQTV